MKKLYMPHTVALAAKLKASFGRGWDDDGARSPTRQYQGKRRKKSRSGKRRTYFLAKGKTILTPRFWSPANLERHCAKRGFKYA